MRTYDRNGVHIEQCDNCRGIFLDYGELETLARLETQYRQPPPPVVQPGWGGGHAPHVQHHGGHHGHGRHGSMFGMLFST
jgi:Zn-finger nucleic acid-binding protein